MVVMVYPSYLVLIHIFLYHWKAYKLRNLMVSNILEVKGNGVMVSRVHLMNN